MTSTTETASRRRAHLADQAVVHNIRTVTSLLVEADPLGADLILRRDFRAAPDALRVALCRFACPASPDVCCRPAGRRCRCGGPIGHQTDGWAPVVVLAIGEETAVVCPSCGRLPQL